MALPVGQSLHLPRRGDGSIWTPDRAVVEYDLTAGGLRPVPFAFSWPSPPINPQPVIVSGNSELASAIAAGGREITLAAGVYSGITINTSDVLLNINSGVSISAAGGASLSIGGNRVRITGDGGATMTGGWRLTGDDIFIERQNMSNADGENVIIQGGAARVAIISSTMQSTRFTLQSWGGASDIIVANSRITVTSQTAARMAKVDRLLLVDNLFDASAAGPAHAMRFGEHYVNDLWFLGNQIEDTGTFGFQLSPVDPDNTGVRVTSSGLYFYDSNLYSGGNTAFTFFDDSQWFEDLYMDNFTIHSGFRSPGASILPAPTDNVDRSVANNWNEASSSYQAQTSAPAWSMN